MKKAIVGLAETLHRTDPAASFVFELWDRERLTFGDNPKTLLRIKSPRAQGACSARIPRFCRKRSWPRISMWKANYRNCCGWGFWRILKKARTHCSRRYAFFPSRSVESAPEGKPQEHRVPL